MEIGFIGLTDTVRSMIRWIMERQPQRIYISGTPQEHPEELAREAHLLAVREQVLMHQAEVVILGEPKQTEAVLMPLLSDPRTILVSLDPALSLTQLSERFGHRPLIRLIPDAHVTIGHSVSVLTANELVPQTIIHKLGDLFASFGDVLVLEEALTDQFVRMRQTVIQQTDELFHTSLKTSGFEQAEHTWLRNALLAIMSAELITLGQGEADGHA